MDFRVTVGYPVSDPRPDAGQLERLRGRLEAALPDAEPRVALSTTTLDVALTVQADHEVDAIADAVGAADGILDDVSIRAIAQPASLPHIDEP